ncbi:MAG: methyltransferase [Rhodobiaceae bacterium]|nr:methyltransferase [Hyphomonas sp.]MCC0050335.1 methyltransferase [Rhodobiaceae bacterium]
MTNIYEEADRLDERVRQGAHREVIGGLWDELGTWQFEFCKQMGLLPAHQMLDIGCGSLRGGVHFVRYLDPNHYAGLDVHASLLDAGYERELGPAGLQDRLDRSRLIASDRFDASSVCKDVDFALAQSVFTHIPLNMIRLCLAQLVGVMRPGGRLFATYFEVEEGSPVTLRVERGHGIVSQYEANPYHFPFSDLQQAADGLPIAVRRIGDVGHPRGQFVAEFRFFGSSSPGHRSDTRKLPIDEAMKLRAGADHYRAYVGPPRRFDFMSSTQFALLHSLGLREEDKVLDVGCGSLRLGRLLIPFLREGNYHGIDPNDWLILEGATHELGMAALRLKHPNFASNADFDFSVFDVPFDFIIAQSVATHTGNDQLDKLLRGAADALSPLGVFLFSYIRAEEPCEAPDGWHYPACVEYTETDMVERLKTVGLAAKPIPWFHPAANWILAARSPEALPSDADAAGLTGHVVNRITDTKGYVFKG